MKTSALSAVMVEFAGVCKFSVVMVEFAGVCKFSVLLLLLLLLLSTQPAAAVEVQALEIRTYTQPRLELTVLGAIVEVPTDHWELVSPEAIEGMRQVQLQMDEKDLESFRGARARKLELKGEIRAGRFPLHEIYRVIQNVEVTNANAYSDVEMKREIDDALGQNPWAKNRRQSFQGPFYFRIPGATIPAELTNDRVPLVFELRPFVDDGKHFVLFTNGRVERVDVDRDLLARHGATLAPILSRHELERGPTSEVVTLHICGLLPRENVTSNKRIEISLRRVGDEDGSEGLVTVQLDLDRAQSGDSDILERWVALRAREWYSLARESKSSVLPIWFDRFRELYGVKENFQLDSRRRQRDRDRSTSLLNVLGGRAAIRETLQMQALQASSTESERTIPLSSLKGVQVKSHPYEEMLAGETGGRLPIADQVPADRFMVYFSRPAALAAALEGGVDFVFAASRTVNRNSLDYGLKERYLAKLGLNPAWVQAFFKSGAVDEMALVFPDLFFIDGTEVSAILRVPHIDSLRSLVALLGVRGLADGKIVEVTLPGYRNGAFWSTRGDLVFLSTHRGELERILALNGRAGEGSLGQSAEFRYMLTKLELRESTRGFAYLSDPFIRRLVGPEVKIAQLRRLRSRADLESISAGALLSLADGQPGEPTVEGLAALGYVSRHVAGRGYRIDRDLVAHSELYGTPSDMASLLDVSVDRVTPSERDAYNAYVQNYSRFWRQFFDPIAARADDLGDGEYELEVFILPLLDSSIYQSVRNFLVAHGDGPPLRVPAFEPKPVAQISLQLREEMWLEFGKDLDRMLVQFGFAEGLIDQLGPSLHLALLDGDPVLNIGSGDVFGGFGMRLERGFRNEEMFVIPMLLSALTRPCRLAIELKDADRVLEILRFSTFRKSSRERWGWSFDLVRVNQKDSWILTVDIFGFARLRLGVEVQDGFLVVTNIPWTQAVELRGLEEGHLDSAFLEVSPGSGELQLAGLFTSAIEQDRSAALAGAAHLFPLMLSGVEDMASAQARHRALFGFTPVHPGGGAYTWTGRTVGSTLFGTGNDQQQPAYKPGDRDFGLMSRIDALKLSMQLEDDGLRTRLRWRLR